MRPERIEFKGHNGDMLAARLDRPVRRPHAYALFAHCFTCSQDIAAARRIAGKLASLGIAVVRFDFTGLGHSEGEFANTTFTSNIQDLIAAADFMRENYAAPLLIIGHSLGGAAAIAAAAGIPESRAVVTIGAPHDPEHVLQNFATSLDDIVRDGAADVTLAGRQFTIGRGFVEDIRATTLDGILSSFKKALLVLHSPQDTIVGIDNASGIFLAAKHPKSFVTLDRADHLLTRAEDADYAAGVIAAWSQRYLGSPAPEENTKAPEGVVRVSEADPNGFLQDVAVGTKHALADEPVAYGGTDLGFTPYQLVSAGLGACTSMTLRMYARRQKWALDHVSVDVTHAKIHATDCAECETKTGKVDMFQRDIQIAGDLTDEQHSRLLEIADRCPVHRTLENEIKIETKLV